jgi:hypothetical protein
MKLVICGANGESFFSGESLLNDHAESRAVRRRPSIAPVPIAQPRGRSVASSESEFPPPPESGVFPVRLYSAVDESDGEVSESSARLSGVFARNATYDEVSDDGVSLEHIDTEWRILLSA